MITLVLSSVCQIYQPCLYCLPNHLVKGKSVSLLQRVQGCCSLLIIVYDKNLEFTTKLRVTTCYLLVLIYYLAMVFHMVHTFIYYLLIVIYLLITSHCPVFFICLLSCILSYSVLCSLILCPISCYFPRLILSLLLCPIFSYSLIRFDVP